MKDLVEKMVDLHVKIRPKHKRSVDLYGKRIGLGQGETVRFILDSFFKDNAGKKK